MMALTVVDVRPKWWTLIVSITFIIVPTVMVSLFFIMPETMFLNDNYIQDKDQAAIFRNIARSNACGDALAIVICCVLVTTNDMAIFKLCNTFLVIWIGLENLMVIVEFVTYGKLTDGVGDTIDFIDFLLMLYMFWKLHRVKDNDTTAMEAAPILL
jgi:hypothetical protein